MSESVQVSDELYERLESHRRADETMEDALRRLVGEPRQGDATGPHPEEVAGIVSSETAEKMRERIEQKDAVDVADKRELRERFE